jgi:hypothetical protein
MNKADWESLAPTRRRIEEIVMSSAPKGTQDWSPFTKQISQLIRVVHDAWDHKLSIPDSEREHFDADFTTTEDDS